VPLPATQLGLARNGLAGAPDIYVVLFAALLPAVLRASGRQGFLGI
jgi:hypothetical protein